MSDLNEKVSYFKKSGRFGLLFALFSLVLLFQSIPQAYAHYLGESYLFLNIRDDAIDGHVDIPLAELEDALFAGEVTDGILTPEEIEANIDRIRAYVAERVELGTAEAWYPLRFTEHVIMDSPEVPFVQLFFKADNGGEVPSLMKVRYSILFETHPLHRALLVVESNEILGTTNPEEKSSLIFKKDSQTQELDLTEQSWMDLFITYFEHGMFHIAIGIDHILFLVALLLISVLKRKDGKWVACDSLWKAFLNVVAIVTLFTISHSITLALAALEIVTLPIRFVESVIALTVIVAALHNIFPFVEGRVKAIVFLFGLFHGFGFADVLAGLGFQDYSLVATLLGFNLGVEAGQLLIVAAIFPLLYLARNFNAYRKAGLYAGSSAIAMLGVVWFVERAFGLEFL